MSQANADGILAAKKADKIPSILIKDLKRNKYIRLSYDFTGDRLLSDISLLAHVRRDDRLQRLFSGKGH